MPPETRGRSGTGESFRGQRPVALVELIETAGISSTVTVRDWRVHWPPRPSLASSVTVWVPTEENLTEPGSSAAELAGLPPPKPHAMASLSPSASVTVELKAALSPIRSVIAPAGVSMAQVGG